VALKKEKTRDEGKGEGSESMLPRSLNPKRVGPRNMLCKGRSARKRVKKAAWSSGLKHRKKGGGGEGYYFRSEGEAAAALACFLLTSESKSGRE